MMELKADLHIHSVLSPCGDWSMSPSAIFEKAKQKNLDIIALTDHNSIYNNEALIQCAEESDLMIIPGIELQTREDVHILGYFRNYDKINAFYSVFKKSLPAVKNVPEQMGSQIIVDRNDNVIEEMGNFLVVSSSMDIDSTLNLIHDFNGLAIASHVDRMAYSIISQLGFIPDGIQLDGIETVSDYKDDRFISICNSDAHYIEDIGKQYSIIETANNSENGFDILKESLNTHSIRCFKEVNE